VRAPAGIHSRELAQPLKVAGTVARGGADSLSTVVDTSLERKLMHTHALRAGNSSATHDDEPTQLSFLTTEDVAVRYRTSPGAVRQWRHQGVGPRGIKIGARVLYAEADLIRFEEDRRAQGHWV
jgi:hypothetical protein